MAKTNKTFIEKFCGEEYKSLRLWISVLFSVLPLAGIILLFFAPICLAPLKDGVNYSVSAANAFESLNSTERAKNSFAFVQLAFFCAIIAIGLIVLVNFIKALFSFSNEERLHKSARSSVIWGVSSTAIFAFIAYIFSPINVMLGGFSSTDIKLFPVIYTAAVAILFAAFMGMIISHKKLNESTVDAKELERTNRQKKLRRSLFSTQIEFLAYTLISVAVAILALMSKIITVTFDVPNVEIPSFTISGKTLILNTDTLTSSGERVMAFVLFTAFIITLVAAFVSLISFLSRSRLFNKVALSTAIIGTATCLLVGLFGQYYKIVQELNADIVDSILNTYHISVKELLNYEITSSALVYFLISLGVLTVLILRRPYTKAEATQKKLDSEFALTEAEGKSSYTDRNETAAKSDIITTSEAISEDIDPCPALTELDGMAVEYKNALLQKRESMLEDPTLPKLVDFIVQYARNSRLHLYYTHESVATFLAGLGSTKLTILQGMSGTGKTSLPKIVAEALMSVCDIVEVESSWRDKNDLLGYYNEFNKVYSPKKFTQALYKASLDPDTLTFIVLDEMNLSRIEYYFSDFLSLMENEPDRRELKLLNTPIWRIKDGKRISYKNLNGGHTLKIPSNVWFIGTANRDESTYDISDKVYDRAHTMNFDKRAQKPLHYGEPMEAQYLPADALIRLFEDAKANFTIDLDRHPMIASVEKLLEPYNISFGNRIAMQIESFVSIYAACFASTDIVINDALDTILLSKIVRKLETKSIEDKEYLASEFEKLRLTRCSQFIMSLKED